MSPRGRDAALRWSAWAAAACSAYIAALIVAFLGIESLPALRDLGPARFLLDDGWHPTAPRAQYNLVPMVAATLAVTAGAVALAAPLGIAAAVFERFYAPPALARWHRRAVELMAGIPSVVFGLWGLVRLAPLIRRLEPPGTSLLAGIVVLALMIVPTVALLSGAALRQVPRAHLEAAAALALSRWSTVAGVALPSARRGLTVAVGLGVLRAAGETMAVLMVCGNVVRLPVGLFQPVRTLTANIALELGYATGDHRSALFVSGLVLMAVVIAGVAFAHRGSAEVGRG